MGRPSTYNETTAELICSLIAAGESTRKLTEREDMPSWRTVFRWLATNEDFRQRYARAKELQAEVLAEEILDIADDGTNDYRTDDEGNEVVDHDHIQRSRLRVDSRKWLLSKLLPKKYGERSTVELEAGENLAAVLLERRRAIEGRKVLDVDKAD